MVDMKSLGLAPQQIPAFQPGATSASQSALLYGQQSREQSACLSGNCNNKIGGNKYKSNKYKSNKYKTGGSTIVVPPINGYGVPDNGQRQQNMNDISSVTAKQFMQRGYDSCVGQGPGCSAHVTASQKALIGGVKWGCRSGGNKKTKKRKTKKRKTRRHFH